MLSLPAIVGQAIEPLAQLMETAYIGRLGKLFFLIPMNPFNKFFYLIKKSLSLFQLTSLLEFLMFRIFKFLSYSFIWSCQRLLNRVGTVLTFCWAYTFLFSIYIVPRIRGKQEPIFQYVQTVDDASLLQEKNFKEFFPPIYFF